MVLLSGSVSADAPSPSLVVVELFESQGCSSCPPAEKVLRQLQSAFASDILLLDFHVDYWDNLGWKDTFSDARWTDRQKVYARAFGQDSIYTPEMVIQGEVGFVGSDLSQARAEIQMRQKRARPELTAHVQWVDPNHARLSVHLPPTWKGIPPPLTAVVYENAPSVHVLRGENAGVTMGGDFAVRDLREMPAPEHGQSVVAFTRDSSWKADALGFVVLARGDNSAIVSAQVASLSVKTAASVPVVATIEKSSE